MKVRLKVELIEDALCLVVSDRVVADGELVENTADWFAQDIDVWYCGKIAKKFEIYKNDDRDKPENTITEG